MARNGGAMEITLKYQPAFSLAIASLGGNEEIKVEPGAMVSHSEGVQMETKAQGGLMGGFKRMIGGESFFQNTFQAPSQGGEITLAPSLTGDMRVLEIDSQGEFMLQSGGYVASEMGVQFGTQWGGARGFFGTGGLLLLKVSGSGKVLIASYGAIEERELSSGQKYIVDTGHVVGFDGTVNFQVRKSGGWKSTLLGGEGLVVELTGPGRVFMQTRSEAEFLKWLMPHLPKRSN